MSLHKLVGPCWCVYVALFGIREEEKKKIFYVTKYLFCNIIELSITCNFMTFLSCTLALSSALDGVGGQRHGFTHGNALVPNL